MLSGLSVVATLKVSRAQTSLMVWKPEPIAGALPLALGHPLIFRRAETSQQDLSLVDGSSEAGIQPLKGFVALYMSSVTTNALGRLLSVAD